MQIQTFINVVPRVWTSKLAGPRFKMYRLNTV